MKFWFGLFICIVVLANFLAIFYLDLFADRWFRFGATFLFLLIYVLKYFSSKRLFSIFLLLAICDGLIVFYEISIVKNTLYLVRILAYLNLILLVIPVLNKLVLNLVTVLISVFVIGIDIYLLHEMAESLPESDKNPLFLSLFYLLGFFSLAIVAACLSYLNRYANKKAFLLVIAAFGFVLSDIFYYNAYYLDFEVFYYLDRLANILGIGALLLFSRRLKNKDKNSVSASTL